LSRLSDLLAQVERSDPALAADLRSEVKALSERRQFGLNFERHQPEAVELPGRPVRRGDKVRALPPRGSTSRGDSRIWLVLRVAGEVATLALDEERTEVPVADLVVVAEYRDPIYPGLRSTGRVERGAADDPFHTVINAENFHALEALLYTHEGKVDAIYIDPPYNTGAKDWKYNNDYVDGDDDYRHSKWLAFMERRLKLAQRLLNPDNSVLIVTIDEKEYLRLGLLLQQTFPEGRITMVSSSINSAGATRKGSFARAAEYLYFVMLGTSRPAPLPLEGEWNAVKTDNKLDIYWSRLIRSGADSARHDSPNQFYPIFIGQGADGPEFYGVGDAHFGDRGDLEVPRGEVAIWPLRRDGSEGRWRISAQALRSLISEGHVRIGAWRAEATTIYYLKQGESAKVAGGDFAVTGRRSDGSVITDASNYVARFVPTDIWRITSHDAGNSGSRLIDRLLGGRKFPFPKSLYAVEDALRFFVSDKPNAVVLDFFSGSGTTVHAVMRLNKQDGGRRQCISVTNNEVSADEQKKLREQGLRPGDPEWERWGICDYITKPRIRAAITGRTPDGDPIKGDYKFTDEFPMSDGFTANAEFFTLTYEAPRTIAHHKSFEAIAPLLWLKAGATGRRIDRATDTFEVADTYGVLFSVDAAGDFLAELVDHEGARMAFIVTDDERAFQMVCADLPDHVEPVRLYESYLASFTMGTQA